MIQLTIDVIKGFRTRIKDFSHLEIFQIISGHINVTYCCTERDGTGAEKSKYIFQRINHHIFKKPEELMQNIVSVCDFAAEYAGNHGKDPERATLHVIPAVSGKSFLVDEEGNYWRCYDFLRNSENLSDVEVNGETYVQAGKTLAEFERSLMDFDASHLFEVIPDFHNTVKRFENLEKAIRENKSGRAKDAEPEITYALGCKSITGLIVDGLASGEIPLRVTNNDTKLSNIMIDKDTKEVLCFIDLDTVMPGSALYDFGDALRTAGSSGAEDEPDLSKIHFVTDNFRAFCKGYVPSAKDFLTEKELRLLPESVAIMTYECGIRFLSDFLDGDTYFATRYPEHNLVRTRTQFRLVQEILDNLEELHAIVAEYC